MDVQVVSKMIDSVKVPAGTLPPDTMVIQSEGLQRVIDVLTEELSKVVVRGFEVAYQFPSIALAAKAQRLGFFEGFRETWQKAAQKDADMDKLLKAWPDYIAAVVVDAPDWMKDAGSMTAGEVNAVVMGFFGRAMEIRKS